jgi:hypothetical protein
MITMPVGILRAPLLHIAAELAHAAERAQRGFFRYPLTPSRAPPDA